MSACEQIRRAWNYMQRRDDRDPSIQSLASHTHRAHRTVRRWIDYLDRYGMIEHLEEPQDRVTECHECERATIHYYRGGVWTCLECDERTV